MTILAVEQYATVLQLGSVAESDDLLLEQVKLFTPRSRFLILSLKDVFLNTFLIGDIINAYNHFAGYYRGQVHRMAIVDAGDAARRVFDLTRLSTKIPVYPTLGDALHDLPAGPIP